MGGTGYTGLDRLPDRRQPTPRPQRKTTDRQTNRPGLLPSDPPVPGERVGPYRPRPSSDFRWDRYGRTPAEGTRCEQKRRLPFRGPPRLKSLWKSDLGTPYRPSVPNPRTSLSPPVTGGLERFNYPLREPTAVGKTGLETVPHSVWEGLRHPSLLPTFGWGNREEPGKDGVGTSFHWMSVDLGSGVRLDGVGNTTLPRLRLRRTAGGTFQRSGGVGVAPDLTTGGGK